jgi:hypothetical protein
MFNPGVVFAIVASGVKVAMLPTVSTVLSLELMKRTPLAPPFKSKDVA